MAHETGGGEKDHGRKKHFSGHRSSKAGETGSSAASVVQIMLSDRSDAFDPDASIFYLVLGVNSAWHFQPPKIESQRQNAS